jgi:hypothetical protein
VLICVFLNYMVRFGTQVLAHILIALVAAEITVAQTLEEPACDNLAVLSHTWDLALLFSFGTILIYFLHWRKGLLSVLICLACLIFHPGFFSIQNRTVEDDCGVSMSNHAIFLTFITFCCLTCQIIYGLRQRYLK